MTNTVQNTTGYDVKLSIKMDWITGPYVYVDSVYVYVIRANILTILRDFDCIIDTLIVKVLHFNEGNLDSNGLFIRFKNIEEMMMAVMAI